MSSRKANSARITAPMLKTWSPGKLVDAMPHLVGDDGALLAVALPPRFGEMDRPDWMKIAERAARTLRATTAGERGATHSVYVVLLHDQSLQGRWGLYVGQTSRDPDLRFDQHKARHKASRAVTRFGVALLPHLVAHLNPMRAWESLDLEAALANAFRTVGIQWIEGGH